jgi:hypothetical protein
MQLAEFVDVSAKRYRANLAQRPAVPELGPILTERDHTIVATYDHLRSPFSSRLVSADARLQALAQSVGARPVVLLLDATMTPLERFHGTAKGDRIGLPIFSQKLSAKERLVTDPSVYLFRLEKPKAPSLTTHDVESGFKKSVATFLRNNKGVGRMAALQAAETMAIRAQGVIRCYREALTSASAKGLSVPRAFLEARNALWRLLNLESYTSGLHFVLFSEMRMQFALALEAIAQRGYSIARLAGASNGSVKLMECVGGDGTHRGSICYDRCADSFRVQCSAPQPAMGRPINLRDLHQMVADGSAIPSTRVIYAVYHLLGGIPHYGNSYDLNPVTAGLLGVSRPDVDVSPDGDNSIPIGEIVIRSQQFAWTHKHLTMDALWFGGERYRRIVARVVETGTPAFNFDFGLDLPESP